MNRDIFYIISSKLDDKTLSVLSSIPAYWEEIKSFSEDQHFWYLRVENLFHRDLLERKHANWKNAYRLLREVVDKQDKFVGEVLGDPLSVEILLEIGEDPTLGENYAVRYASQEGYIEVIKLLLAIDKVDPGALDSQALSLASKFGRTEVVKLLLADKRVNPSPVSQEKQPILMASWMGHAEIVKLLLADPRVHPRNVALALASQEGRIEVAKLLLADPRIDPTANDNGALSAAVRHGRTEIVKLLLEDGRVDPTHNNHSIFYEPALSSENECLIILAADRRVDLQALLLPIIDSIVNSIPIYRSDALEECLRLSDRVDAEGILYNMKGTYFNSHHYYILLREILVKRLDIAYYLQWLEKMCRRSTDYNYRKLISDAASSFLNTGRVVHTSAMFTAYSGFILLAKSNNYRAILNTLTQEGASQEGLELAGMLLGAFLGKKRPSKQ